MTLKTLKDLEKEYNDELVMSTGKMSPILEDGWNDDDIVNYVFKELQSEAVKWVKELKSRTGHYCLTCQKSLDEGGFVDFRKMELCKNNNHILLYNVAEQDDMTPMITILKHLFDLSEEDMK